MEFHAFNFHPQVAAGITAAGYVSPTPIQVQAIPPVLEGSDVMGLAQTGTGKTAAFVLPILERLMQGERGHVRALIIAPTRELAEQIHEAIVTMGQQTRLRSVTVYGGVSINPQIQQLRAGVEIVVACPGRLLDHINHRTINLAHLELLVLDEADRMFDMGFLPIFGRSSSTCPQSARRFCSRQPCRMISGDWPVKSCVHRLRCRSIPPHRQARSHTLYTLSISTSKLRSSSNC